MTKTKENLTFSTIKSMWKPKIFPVFWFPQLKMRMMRLRVHPMLYKNAKKCKIKLGAAPKLALHWSVVNNMHQNRRKLSNELLTFVCLHYSEDCSCFRVQINVYSSLWTKIVVRYSKATKFHHIPSSRNVYIRLYLIYRVVLRFEFATELYLWTSWCIMSKSSIIEVKCLWTWNLNDKLAHPGKV